jgi:acyl-coenzyme A thioesterase PaaI-like protein
MSLYVSRLNDAENLGVMPYSAGPQSPPAGTRALRAHGLFGPAEAREFLAELLSPWTRELGLTVEACSPAGTVLRLPRNPRILRPGNALSGQALLACADTAMAIAIMGHLGKLQNVATVTIAADFMRAMPDGDAIVAATVRRRCRTLVFTECTFVQPRTPGIAVHATATWALIPAAL